MHAKRHVKAQFEETKETADPDSDMTEILSFEILNWILSLKSELSHRELKMTIINMTGL